jgi:hypothetical protein
MNGAGIKNLGDVTITTAVTDSVITESSSGGVAVTDIRGLAGMTRLTAWASFVYGSSGTTVAAVIQTSIDQGSNWIDIIRFDFTTASRKAHAAVGSFSAGAVTTLATLGSEGKLDNILGDRLRCKITSTGTYAGNTSLAVRVNVS